MLQLLLCRRQAKLRKSSMTITEIQATIDELRHRHSGLDEKLLVTLLRAGGWEEDTIKEGLVLFRMTPAVASEIFPDTSEALLPSPHDMLLVEKNEIPEVPKKPLLESVIHDVHDYLPAAIERKQDAPPQSVSVQPEKESFVAPKKTSIEDQDLPENLSLKPFESSPHVWSFAKYKDVFHNDAQPETITLPPEKKPTVPPPPQVSVPRPASAPLDAEDEGLIVMAGILLVLVLLILGYMYSLGRL